MSGWCARLSRSRFCWTEDDTEDEWWEVTKLFIPSRCFGAICCFVDLDFALLGECLYLVGPIISPVACRIPRVCRSTTFGPLRNIVPLLWPLQSNQCLYEAWLSTQCIYNSGFYRCLYWVKITVRVIPLALELNYLFFKLKNVIIFHMSQTQRTFS